MKVKTDLELLILSETTQVSVRRLLRTLTTEEQREAYINMCSLLIELINSLAKRRDETN